MSLAGCGRARRIAREDQLGRSRLVEALPEKTAATAGTIVMAPRNNHRAISRELREPPGRAPALQPACMLVCYMPLASRLLDNHDKLSLCGGVGAGDSLAGALIQPRGSLAREIRLPQAVRFETSVC